MCFNKITTTHLAFIIAAVLVAVGSLSAPPAHAKTSVTISQGQLVLVPDQGICTVGYVDKETRRAYLADHCVNKKGHRTSPVVVRDLQSGEPLGTAVPINKMGIDGGGDPMQDERFDVNFIDLADHVAVGENHLSGDSRVNAYDIEKGDEVCVFSSQHGKVSCGYAWSTVGSVIKVHISGGEGHKAVTFGDSGGPAWIPGKGFIGVLASMGGKTIWYTSIDTRDCTIEQVVDRLEPEGFGVHTCPVGSEYSDVSPYNYAGTRTSAPSNPQTQPSPSHIGSSAGGALAAVVVIIATLLGVVSFVGIPGLH